MEGMITAREVVPLLLSACPSFRPVWEREVEAENLDEESPGDRLGYVDAGDFIRHLVSLRLEDRTEEFPAVFDVIERLVVKGDAYVRNLGVIGYLEGLQMETVTSAGLDPERDFRPFLRPKSLSWWQKLDRFWEGDTTALRESDPGD